MGPLIFCTNCGKYIYFEYEIFQKMKKDLNVTSEMLSVDQYDLLGDKLVKMFDDFGLGICCRSDILSYHDYGRLIYRIASDTY